MRFPRSHLLLLSSAFALSPGCGEGVEGDDVIQFREPQIVPESNVLCLSYQQITVGTRSRHFVSLSNRGRDPLVVRGAMLEDNRSGAFEVDRVRSVAGVDCSEAAPLSIPSTEAAILSYYYSPSEAGWDSAFIRVLSNAQNFPRLRLFVLARAEPAGLDAGTPFDAGPKPPETFGADGSEPCP